MTVVNKLDWSTFTQYTGLDIEAALDGLNARSLGALTASVDLAVDGGVALNVLDGVLVAKGDFTIALGQVRSAALPSGATQDADVMTLTLENVGVFVGVGGSLATTDGRRTTRSTHDGGGRHARVWGDGHARSRWCRSRTAGPMRW